MFLRRAQLFNEFTGLYQLAVPISLLLLEVLVLLIELAELPLEYLILAGKGHDLLRAFFLGVGHILYLLGPLFIH